MLTGLFAVAILVARLFPQTPAGKWLHLHLVDLPMQGASGLERKYVILALLILFAGPALSAAIPVDMAFIYALDLSVYLDAFVAVGTAAALTRCKMAWAAFKARTASVMRALRTVRPPSGKKRAARMGPHRRATNDDDAEPSPSRLAA